MIEITYLSVCKVNSEKKTPTHQAPTKENKEKANCELLGMPALQCQLTKDII